MKYTVTDPDEDYKHIASSHKEAMLHYLKEYFGNDHRYMNEIPNFGSAYHESENVFITDELNDMKVFVFCEWDEAVIYYWETLK